jgi:hypothetical protein
MWNHLVNSSDLGYGLIVMGFLMMVVGLMPFDRDLVFYGFIFLIIGVLWNKREDRFEQELLETGVFQKWVKEEPATPPILKAGEMALYAEARPHFQGEFTIYDYPGSDILGGVSHIQCNICHKWSVFPLLHIDGMAYRQRELAIHRAICHPQQSENKANGSEKEI